MNYSNPFMPASHPGHSSVGVSLLILAFNALTFAPLLFGLPFMATFTVLAWLRKLHHTKAGRFVLRLLVRIALMTALATPLLALCTAAAVINGASTESIVLTRAVEYATPYTLSGSLLVALALTLLRSSYADDEDPKRARTWADGTKKPVVNDSDARKPSGAEALAWIGLFEVAVWGVPIAMMLLR